MVRLFDTVLALLLVWLAWRAVSDSDPLRAVVQFIVLGLMLALSWLRLGAPDVALAEAAVGSGLTGALLLVTLRRWQEGRSGASGSARGSAVIHRGAGWLVAMLAFAVLGWALLGLPETPTDLAREAYGSLAQSGVTNPVTAVLLNYRGYDTLLEVAVLLLAILAVWSLRSMPISSVADPAGPILTALLRFLLPLLVLVSGYLLWIGAFAPGGAFQGGALLGGAIVLILLGGGLRRSLWHRRALLRTGLWLGLAVFVGVGLGVMLAGGRFLEYPEGRAGGLILLIEGAALLSIGVTLGALFFGGRPAPEDDPRAEAGP